MDIRIASAAVAALVAGTAIAGGNFGTAYYKVNGGTAQSIGAFDFTDNGAFASGNNRFNNTILRSMHDELNALSGVDTNNKLTFVVGQTSEGLSMFALFDREGGSESGPSGTGVNTTASFDYAGGGVGFQNERGELGGDMDGAFRWIARRKGDGFAATQISNDFSDSFTISDFDVYQNRDGGLNEAAGVQVISLDANGNVQVIDLNAASFFGNGGNFAFAVPVPAAGALAGVGLLGVAVRRRR